MLLVPVASVAARAQAPCRTCSSQGERPCKRHKGFEELEAAVRHCSVVAACRSCAGALATDCAKCDRGEVEASLSARQAAAEDWLAARRSHVDAFAKKGTILHGQSDHVDLAFSIPSLTVGRRKFDSHRLLHLYLERIEALRALFLATFGLNDQDFSARVELFVFADRDDHVEVAPRVAGGGASAGGMKLMGTRAVYCMWRDRRLIRGDEELHRTLIHNTTHLLLANATPEQWIGNRSHGWLDEGIAYWFEDKLTGKCLTYCYEEVGVLPAAYHGGRWRVPVRKLLEADRLVSFAEVSRRNIDQLSSQERAQSLAYVDFLLAQHGGPSLYALVRRLKEKQTLRQALTEEIGTTVLEFDRQFRAWVRETYPLKEAR